jgi:HSP20 family protein
MMMPRIFGENLFDDFMNDFAFPDFTDSANIGLEEGEVTEE